MSSLQLYEALQLTRNVHRILYQRGIYPPEDFKMVKKYGLTLFTSADESLEAYIQSVMKQVQGKLPSSKSTARANSHSPPSLDPRGQARQSRFDSDDEGNA